MKKLALLILLALVTIASTTGCSKRYRVEIQSDTCWDGLVNNDQSIYGCGNSSYKVIGKLSCVKIQKRTNDGYIRVRIDGRAWSEETAPLGVVQVCN
ncbi:MAG: hypothetical protein U0704_17500 [Candidatus Eisenbacteria bacterium]